ncbi:MAG TPA: TIM barrel protein [Xanthobacteraceae bacterium]|jgi:4-hydroxyphenylpyruvate dioxygenase
METSIATVCLSGDLRDKLRAIAAAGFRGVEIFESDLLSYNGTPADVAKEMADLGLRAITFQPFRDFEGMPDAQRQRTFDRAERKFDLMQELACGLLMACSSVAPDAIGGVDRAAADYRELGERAKKRGLRIGFEALAWGRHVNDYRDAWEVVRRADHPAVGLVLDTFHIFARRTDIKAIPSIPGDRIFLVQLADAPRLDMDVIQWSRHFRCFPGQGDFPLVDFMAAVQATGYRGDLSLEIFNDQFRAGSPRTVAVDGQRSLAFLMDQLRTLDARAAADVAPMPPRSACLGVAFIEFAVDDRTADELGRFIASLGFRAVARHKSKAVTRWAQGDVNLIINQDKEGFAHAHFVTHGPSVCAIALKVANAAATLDRAEKLHDTPFRSKVGPGELEIPCVRGLGGSLLYFLDPGSQLAKVWDIDFDPIDTTATDDSGGLTVVDHISQSMHYEEMLSWLLFYGSLFDVRKTPQVDITEPGGIVRSQVVESADGALRIALNASQSVRTQSSRFLSEYFGSGVQHIALATDDIFATADRLRANGVELLRIPENYYDDLAARLDLDAAQLDRLQARNILYDKDEHGEYFQLYTRSFKDLFFIEIVQRRGYVGFGAVNASIRLSAQSRVTQDRALSGL